MFTREFYIRLNKWDKEQQSLPKIDADTVGRPINEVMPDESSPEGTEIAERFYHVSGWILTSGRKRKHPSIVTVSTLLSGKKHTTSSSLPTQLVDESQQFDGNLVYPKESFFLFVAYMEEICRNVLQHHNIMLFGNRLFQELCSVILNCEERRDLF